jgi:hypothetical protein
MKLLIAIAAILITAIPASAQTPAVGSHSAAVNSNAAVSVTLSVKQGDLVIVFCVPDPTAAAAASDGAGDKFNALPVAASDDSASVAAFWARAATTSLSLTVTCKAPSPVSYNQIYAASISGGGIPTAVPAAGSSGAASGTIGSISGDLLLAMVESGSVTNASGWIAVSTLNSNLLASKAAAGAVTASFSASRAWNLVLVDIPPASVPLPPPVGINLNATLLWDDGTPITGSVQIQQAETNVNTTLAAFPLDTNGSLSGLVTIDLTQPDPLVIQFVLIDSAGKTIGTVQEMVPKLMFVGVTKAVASITVARVSLALRGIAWASQ